MNNAGTEGKPGPITEQTAEGFTAMFETNVLGTLLGMKHELRVMQAARRRQYRPISSTMGERGAAVLSLYTGSKHAVEGITKSAASRSPPRSACRVNAVTAAKAETAISIG